MILMILTFSQKETESQRRIVIALQQTLKVLLKLIFWYQNSFSSTLLLVTNHNHYLIFCVLAANKFPLNLHSTMKYWKTSQKFLVFFPSSNSFLVCLFLESSKYKSEPVFSDFMDMSENTIN
jgi:hypothetical protein